MKKGYKFITVLILLLITTVSAIAQAPCSGDPDDPGYDPNGCAAPLDTWVFVLVAMALIFTVWHIRKQKTTLAGF